MRSLNIDHLKTFMTVVDLGSFSSAARHLHMTQPAVSLHIRALEERFGIQLLNRNGRFVSASVPGLALFEQARAILLDCDRAGVVMKKFREGWIGRVSIGTTLTSLTYHLPPILRELVDHFPGIELIVENMVSRDTVEAVSAGRMDFGLVTLPIPCENLKVTELRFEEMMAILSPRTIDPPEQVTPAYVSEHTLILDHPQGAVAALVRRWLGETHIDVRAKMHVATIDAAKTLVASGVGMSIVPSIAAGGTGILVRPLSPSIPSHVGLLENTRVAESEARRIVRDALLKIGA